MAHDLEILEDGSASMAYTGEVPWHGLGTAVKGLMTASEAIKASNLDWLVSMNPVQMTAPKTAGGFEYINIPNRRAVTRATDNKFLGLVSNGYKPIQNADAFNFFDALVDDGSAKYETAGSLSGGKRVFLTAKIGENMMIAGEDPHDMYLLLLNSHDGTTALKAVTTLVRVVCANTETMALRNSKTEWSLNHRKPLAGRVTEARDALALSFKYQEEFEKEVQRMLDIQISVDRFSTLLEEVLPEQKHATDRKITAMVDLFANSPTITDTGHAGTGWGAMNAVTEYVSHKKSASQDARMISNIFGQGAKFRNDMHKAILETAR